MKKVTWVFLLLLGVLVSSCNSTSSGVDASSTECPIEKHETHIID
jgi:hypothetical protein